MILLSVTTCQTLDVCEKDCQSDFILNPSKPRHLTHFIGKIKDFLVGIKDSKTFLGRSKAVEY